MNGVDFTQLVNYGAIGVCLLACGGFAWFLTKYILKQLTDITATNKQLAETNQKLCEKLDIKLDAILNKLEK